MKLFNEKVVHEMNARTNTWAHQNIHNLEQIRKAASSIPRDITRWDKEELLRDIARLKRATINLEAAASSFPDLDEVMRDQASTDPS